MPQVSDAKAECPECNRLKEAYAEATQKYVKFDTANRANGRSEVREEVNRLQEVMNEARQAFLAHQEQHRG